MDDIPIFHWSGEYFGFIRITSFFNKDGVYLGWLEHKRIWRTDGELLGNLIEEKYVLRCEVDIPLCPKMPRNPPPPPVPPTPSPDLIAKAPRKGWTDALYEL